MRSVPARSESAIGEATAKREVLEKEKKRVEEKLKEVMDSLKQETQGLQNEKEVCTLDAFSYLPWSLEANQHN